MTASAATDWKEALDKLSDLHLRLGLLGKAMDDDRTDEQNVAGVAKFLRRMGSGRIERPGGSVIDYEARQRQLEAIAPTYVRVRRFRFRRFRLT